MDGEEHTYTARESETGEDCEAELIKVLTTKSDRYVAGRGPRVYANRQPHESEDRNGTRYAHGRFFG